jgi:hypothetical protein
LITREQWGADENYLFSDYFIHQQAKQNAEQLDLDIKLHPKKYVAIIKKRKIEQCRASYMMQYYKDELKLDKIINKIKNKQLRWNINYKDNKTKIIIHHTA